MSRILVVDDEPSMREMLSILLGKEGHDVLLAGDRASAAAVLDKSAVDLVVTDLRLPDGDGLEIVRHVRAATGIPVLVMTAYGSTQTAVAALKLGACDYLVKPFDIEEFRIVVRGALERTQLQEENRRLKAELRGQRASGLIGVSPPMVALLDLARSVASANSTVLLTGESGTGKEVIARTIHALSGRADGAFVSINCGALPDGLLESELFGHMKGAFTDAQQTRKGLFEVAQKGTIFLDEVGDMSAPMQVKLLRVLQERRIRRLGGSDEIAVDVRVLAATNRSLDALVKEGKFREDLFYRLNVIPIHVPPLRERREDIPVLADHFLKRFAHEMQKEMTAIAPDALAALQRYGWPGNVRQLENVIERAVALENSPVISVERLPPELLLSAPAAENLLLSGSGFSLDAHLARIEAEFVRQALEHTGWERTAACRLLGVTPRSLRYLLAKHRIAPDGPG